MAAVTETGELPRVCVVVAFHKPSMPLAKRQIDSLIEQQGVELKCVAVLDGAETAGNAELRSLLNRDGVTIVSRPEASGAGAAFANGLEAAIAQAGGGNVLFGYCDQDDLWYADKLRRSADWLRAEGASLVHCDARVVDEAGAEISTSLHRYESRVEPHGLLETLLLNAVTGMTSVFTSETARLALSLMKAYDGELLHDHITAVAAASIGPTGLINAPLLDYVQHTDNNIGAKVHRSAWRRRAFGLLPLNLYRRTSERMFAERRKLCLLLADEHRLPPPLALMFAAGEGDSVAAMSLRYVREIAGLLARGQSRRAMLCIRMMDAALRLRRRRVPGTDRPA